LLSVSAMNGVGAVIQAHKRITAVVMVAIVAGLAGVMGSGHSRLVGTMLPMSNPFPAGQCTWYAWGRRQDLGARVTGDARYWADSARRSGIPVGDTPVVGAVVVFQPGQDGAGPVGHVAYVESISGSQMTISESNFPDGVYAAVDSHGFYNPSRTRTISWVS